MRQAMIVAWLNYRTILRMDAKMNFYILLWLQDNT
jgi:hypothetical protein